MASAPSEAAHQLNNLAALYQRQQRYADAEPLFKRSLAIREKTLGPEHPDVGAVAEQSGDALREAGPPRRLRAVVQASAGDLRERRQVRSIPRSRRVLNNLGQVAKVQGRYAEAEPLIKRSLAIREKVLGRDHPDVARSLNNLAELYERQGRYADAEPLFERALAVRERAVGPDHPDTARSMNNLAAFYAASGLPADALPLVQRMIASGRGDLASRFRCWRTHSDSN